MRKTKLTTEHAGPAPGRRAALSTARPGRAQAVPDAGRQLAPATLSRIAAGAVTFGLIPPGAEEDFISGLVHVE